MDTESFHPDLIVVRDRLRVVDDAKVRALSDSMATLGLLQPVSVWINGDEFPELVAGLHRLRAAQLLGWDSIEAFVMDGRSEIDRQLWEIDENLMRAELTPSQEAQHLARRGELWTQRASSVGGKTLPTNEKRADGRQKGPQHQKQFATETAEATGMSKRAINLALHRAANIAPEAMADLAGTTLDKGVELDALTRLPAAEQRDLAARAKAGEQVTARPAAAPVPAPMPASDDDRRGRIVNQIADLLDLWQHAEPEAQEEFILAAGLQRSTPAAA